jgi:molybdate transport system substrate-binding protein
MRGALGELVPRFERESGISVAMSYDPAKVTLARIAAGESADAVMLGAGAVAELVKQGKVKAESHRTVSRCGVGMAVLAGAPKPDIGTVEAFTRALLGARSIAYTQQGISGMHFAKLIEQLGIADAIKAKAKVQPGGLIGELVARREAEVAIQQVPELLAVPGIELVGPLPADLQLTTVSSIGIFVNAAAPQAAKAFIEFLVSPAAAKVMTAKGHEPVTSDR